MAFCEFGRTNIHFTKPFKIQISFGKKIFVPSLKCQWVAMSHGIYVKGSSVSF